MKISRDSVRVIAAAVALDPGDRSGDAFRFAGHVMPTLPSQVEATVTAPGGAEFHVAGQANEVGYFYDSDDDVIVTESTWHYISKACMRYNYKQNR